MSDEDTERHPDSVSNQPTQRPKYLRGYGSDRGSKVHAIPVRGDDPNPTMHGHGIGRTLCGLRLATSHVAWTPTIPQACQRCVDCARSTAPVADEVYSLPSAHRRNRDRQRFGRHQRWWATAPADRDAHDWLFAAADRLLVQSEVRAAELLMDFADETLAALTLEVTELLGAAVFPEPDRCQVTINISGNLCRCEYRKDHGGTSHGLTTYVQWDGQQS